MDGRWTSHGRDVLFLSTFLASTAIPLAVLKALKTAFDEPLLWTTLSFIDNIGTVVVFTMFWAAIVIRLAGELKLRKGGDDEPSGSTATIPNRR
jgi:hypothetical protein